MRFLDVLKRCAGLLAVSVLSSHTHAREPVSPVVWPSEITAKMRLGKQLFFDDRLSADDKGSCHSCHRFDHGGAAPEARSLMSNGQPQSFNSPSIFNVIHNHRQGWRGNHRTLEDHLKQLLDQGDEMGLAWPKLMIKLQQTEYPQAFNQLYPDGLNQKNLIDALVEFEKGLTTPSPFDAYLAGDREAVDTEVLKGYHRFKYYGCISCHQGRNFGGNLFQRLGVIEPYFDEQNPPQQGDQGRFSLTALESDRFVFRVPSLRNVANTAPYLHNGSIASLEQTISTIAWHQLGRKLSEDDIYYLSRFLESLSGEPHPELRAE